MIILELMMNGDLRNYLKSLRPVYVVSQLCYTCISIYGANQIQGCDPKMNGAEEGAGGGVRTTVTACLPIFCLNFCIIFQPRRNGPRMLAENTS